MDALVLIILFVISLAALLVFSFGAPLKQGHSYTSRPLVPPPAPPVQLPVPPVEPAQESSCFVLGLIKSMKDYPDQWEIEYHYGRYSTSHSMNHARSGVTLRFSKTTKPTNESYSQAIHEGDSSKVIYVDRLKVWASGQSFTTAEQALLHGTIKDYQECADAREALKQSEEAAAQRAPFEALGCPTQSP